MHSYIRARMLKYSSTVHTRIRNRYYAQSNFPFTRAHFPCPVPVKIGTLIDDAITADRSNDVTLTPFTRRQINLRLGDFADIGPNE